jgi:tRNA1(Val) A37 N6-methylase TrmN6
VTDRELKKIIRQWSESPEGVANRGSLKLENAPQLQKLLQDNQHSSRLWELALDECQKFFRKERGVFYTPSAVADLMVENALDAWLEQHGASFEKIKKIRILDPSCGDGEFLISALKKLLTVYRRFLPDAPEKELIKQIINNNLYGIDCDSNALFFLIKKLENLAGCKVKTANFINKNALDFSSAAACFDSSIKFDLVIGNPPYVSYGLRNVNKLDKERSAILYRRFPDSAEYKIALYALFMEFAVNSIKKGAYHSFIVPDSFLCGQYFTKLRNFLLKNCEFEKIWFIRQKIFKATPGALVVYLLRKVKNTNKEHILQTLAVDDIANISEITPYYMLQNEFVNNHRQRFRLFFDRQTHEFIRELENKSICKLGDLFTFASGVIGKKGKNSIVATKPDGSGCWKKGITSGKALHSGEPVKWQGEYINVDPKAVKSGIGKIDYDSDKILIRQTGDKIIAAIDYNKLVVLNNIHIAVSKDPSLDLECMSEYLNSDPLRRYYQAVTLESGRAMAQLDLETLRELPVIKSAVRYKK